MVVWFGVGGSWAGYSSPRFRSEGLGKQEDEPQALLYTLLKEMGGWEEKKLVDVEFRPSLGNALRPSALIVVVRGRDDVSRVTVSLVHKTLYNSHFTQLVCLCRREIPV